MWVTKLLISPEKKGFFAQKSPNLARKWHFWSIWARPCRHIRFPVGGPVGGCGARAVSRKTPIYSIYLIYILLYFYFLYLSLLYSYFDFCSRSVCLVSSAPLDSFPPVLAEGFTLALPLICDPRLHRCTFPIHRLNPPKSLSTHLSPPLSPSSALSGQCYVVRLATFKHPSQNRPLPVTL